MSHYLPGYFWLVERSRRLGYDSRSIIERYDEHIEDVLVNVMYGLSLRSLSRTDGGDERRGVRAPGRRGHRGAARALLGRAARALLGSRRARAAPDRDLDLVLARASRPARPAGGGRPAPRRGAPARPAPLPRAGRRAVGRDGRAELPARLPPVPLLARARRGSTSPGCSCRRSAGWATRTRRPGSWIRWWARSSATASASTTTRSTATASRRGGSAGRRCWSICSRIPRRRERGRRSQAGLPPAGPALDGRALDGRWTRSAERVWEALAGDPAVRRSSVRGARAARAAPRLPTRTASRARRRTPGSTLPGLRGRSTPSRPRLLVALGAAPLRPLRDRVPDRGPGSRPQPRSTPRRSRRSRAPTAAPGASRS